MQTLGLSVPDRREWQQELNRSRGQQIELRVLDLSGRLVTSIKPRANTGQVNVDSFADVTRSCSLSFLDPTGALQFDSDSPNDSALYFDRMVQVRHVTIVPALGVHVECPMFTGPLVKFDRTGDAVGVEAQGRESQALHGVPTLTIRRGANAVGAIRTILTERVGFAEFSFPTRRDRLPRDTVVSWEDTTTPWVVCRRIAVSLGMQLYFDGAGVCRLRDLPTAPVFTFGDDNVTSQVQVSHDVSTIRNRVHVVGSLPAHTAAPVLDDSYPMSPYRLRINGIRQYLTEEVSAPNVRSKAAAAAYARRLLTKYERLEFGTTFNAIPVPHLDERDLIRIDTDGYQGVERMDQFSTALTGGDMTVGFNDLVSLPPRRPRRP